MTTCSRIGCEAEATHVPEIAVPRMGSARVGVRGLTFTVGLPLCKAHTEAFDVAAFFAGNDGRDLLGRMSHGMVVDPNKATVSALPIATISDIAREKLKLEGKTNGKNMG